MRRRKDRLRTEAERQIAQSVGEIEAIPPVEDLLHELQVRRLELEIQNEQLRRTQLDLEESRDRYLDLYEFAPVGYLTLSRESLILEINLTGAALLGQERSKLLQRPFARFVVPEDGDRFYRLLGEVIRQGHQQSSTVVLRRNDNTVIHAQLDCIRVVSEKMLPRVRITLTDITAHRRAAAEIENLAFYDSLTKLPNRRLLLSRLQQMLAAPSATNQYAAVFFIDLDDFKSLNDIRGHDNGDLLLQMVAQKLIDCVRKEDTVARLGGDEFVVLLQGLSENQHIASIQARVVGEKILIALGERCQIGGEEYRGACSIGITLFKGNQQSVEDLLKCADLALYRAKTLGRGRLKFFEPEMQTAVMTKAVLEADLRRGLEEGQFVLRYQPQVDKKGHLIGAEALLRWQHPTRGLLSPADFIPISEEKGLIDALGQLVRQIACSALAGWRSNSISSGLHLAINVSAHEFSHPKFVNHMLTVLDLAGADPHRLILEFTENVMLCPMGETVSKMTALKSHGIRFSLDDFGVAYSSLSYLKNLPLDQLKIDKSFVQDLLVKKVDRSITCSIIALGKSLGLFVVAEGVESQEQRDLLISQGCDAFQGFLFGKAGTMEELLLLAERDKLDSVA